MKHDGFAQMSSISYLFYTIFHPTEGFQELKYNKKGSRLIVFLILVLYTLTELLTRVLTDFDLNSYTEADESLFRVASVSCLTFVIAIVANWCFCTLLDGKGRMFDIAVVGTYSLLPYIFTRLVLIVLSYVTTNSIETFLNYAIVIAILWSFIMIFAGLQVIHEYSVGMTILSLILTVVGIVIIMFIGLLAVQLYQQIFTFISTIVMELRYK